MDRDHDHHEHVHADGTRHSHSHHHPASTGEVVALEARLLEKNDALAAQNRSWFKGREILALNLFSSPGAGKTTLLERTIRDLKDELKLRVIKGHQATSNDGERIRAAGAPAVQINTGCHIDSDMVALGLRALKPEPGSVVMIEMSGIWFAQHCSISASGRRSSFCRLRKARISRSNIRTCSERRTS
ncbi:MAG: GTP-binding protein [Rhodopila sp.]